MLRKKIVISSPSPLTSQWFEGSFTCAMSWTLLSFLSLSLFLFSLTTLLITRPPSPLQHPQFFHPPNHLSAAPTFHDVAIFLPLGMQFVPAVLRSISSLFRMIWYFSGCVHGRRQAQGLPAAPPSYWLLSETLTKEIKKNKWEIINTMS